MANTDPLPERPPMTNQALEQQNKAMRQALEEIKNPLPFIQRRADAEGKTVDGQMAVWLSNDANYLKDIATKALSLSPVPAPDARAKAVEAVVTVARKLNRYMNDDNQPGSFDLILELDDELSAALSALDSIAAEGEMQG